MQFARRSRVHLDILKTMKLAAVLDILRSLAPESLAEAWDRVGLHAGDPAQDVRRGLLCIDLTEDVMSEAVRARVQLIIAYHPPIFEPLRALTTATPRERVLRRAVERGIAIYSPHTALDAAAGGVGEWLADAVGPFPAAGERRAIKVSQPETAARLILVTFVPPRHADRLRAALSAAGAGKIGEYTQCSFGVMGEGTFKPGSGARPVIGKQGRFERVRELRMEMTCPANRVAEVVAALRREHPYETPAFDLYKLQAAPDAAGEGVGQGRVVMLARPMTPAELIRRVKRHLGVAQVEAALPPRLRRVKTIGFVPGAGGSLLKETGEIDAFVTGEMRHHDVLDAKERGIAVILAGHTQTERPYLTVYRKRIVAAGRAIAWSISQADGPPGCRV
jgi:dinuclear metal center YbgI/SA1388 family protein